MLVSGPETNSRRLAAEVDTVNRLEAVPTILDTICQVTGMGFAAVARVTDERWIACSVRDTIDFGMQPGGELKLETTICHEIRDSGAFVIISDVASDPIYQGHHTPALYGFRSYASFPIFLPAGEFFGTLCAIDPQPRDLDRPEVRGMFEMFAKLIGFALEQANRLAASEASRLSQLDTARLQEQFVAVMGHDLRNPLASIQAGITLLEKQPTPERAKMLLARMRLSGDRMAALIADVLDLARGRLGGGIPVSRQLMSIAPIITQVVAELGSTHPGQAILVDCSDDLLIDGDPLRIAQLLSNLLGNALTHGVAEQPVRIVCASAGGQMAISISNGGLKIAPEAIADIFQPFVRGQSGTNRDGLGLGLYISAQIAAAHDGTLSVTSTDAETRFTFQMPIAIAY